MASARISTLTKERLPYPVTAWKAGLPYDPRSAAVEFAYMASLTSKPDTPDWKAGSWDVNLIGGYVALSLVGPGTTSVLSEGDYYVWIRITDATLGETIIRQIDRLLVE